MEIKKTTFRIFLFYFALITLSGCFGSDSISLVKDTNHPFNDTYKLGNVLDRRAICSDLSWEEIEDDKGRTLVEYRCDLAYADDYYEEFSDALREVFDKEIKKKEDELENSVIPNTNKSISDAKESLRVFEKTEAEGGFKDVSKEIYSFEPQECFTWSDYSNKTIQSCVDEYVKRREDVIKDTKIDILDYRRYADIKVDWAKVSKVEEVIQWHVSDEGKVTHLYSGMIFTRENDEQFIVQNFFLNDYYTSMLDEDATDYKSYIKDCGCNVGSYMNSKNIPGLQRD